MSDKIYTVEACFDGYECSWSYMIGVFIDKEKAYQAKDKWEKFYGNNKSIFDGLDSDSDDEEEVNKYYRMSSMYDEVNQFRNVLVTELPLNRDIYSETDLMRTEPMKRLITEWERDYKLDEILRQNQ